MDVADTRFWVCNVHTGVVEDELVVAGDWSLTNRFGGGTMSLRVPLGHLRTKDGLWFDWPAVQQVHALVEPGDHSILVTAGSQVLGEWVVTGATPHTDGYIDVSGDEWEMYPAERSIAVSDRKKTDDLYNLMRWVLTRVFVTDKVVPIAVTLPSGTAGVNKTMEIVARGGLYSDLVSSLTDSTPPMEWRIDISAEWNTTTGRATRAVRTAVFARPIMARTSGLRAYLPGYGERSGNVLAISTPRDWRAWTYQVTGVGAGNGDKRLYVVKERTYAEFPVKLHRGVINQYAEVNEKPWLTALTQGALDASSQTTRTVTDIALHPVRFPRAPKVGEKLDVKVDGNAAYPGGMDEVLRVGEVTVTGAGKIIESLKVLAA